MTRIDPLNQSHPNLPGDPLPLTRPKPIEGQVVRIDAREEAVNEELT